MWVVCLSCDMYCVSLQSIRTRAVKSEDGQHYILNGGKIWLVLSLPLSLSPSHSPSLSLSTIKRYTQHSFLYLCDKMYTISLL